MLIVSSVLLESQIVENGWLRTRRMCLVSTPLVQVLDKKTGGSELVIMISSCELRSEYFGILMHILLDYKYLPR